MENIIETKDWSFGKINKIYKPSLDLQRRKSEDSNKSRTERGDITINITETKDPKKQQYWLYAKKKFGNLEE